MLELIAQGSKSIDRWRRTIPDSSADGILVIGRSSGAWSVPWDSQISRQHVSVELRENGLHVVRLESSQNPVFYKGQKVDRFKVGIGEHFVIGSTTFTVTERPEALSSETPHDLKQQAFDVQQLRRNPFRDAGQRIEVLGRLPDLIASSSSDQELWVRVASVMLQGIPNANVVAVATHDDAANAEISKISVLHYDSRLPSNAERSPSDSLVMKAIETGESVLHLWSGSREVQFTESEGVDWAFCVPIVGNEKAAIGLYVAGAMNSLATASWSQQTAHVSEGLQDDLKFTELIATTVANLRSMRSLQKRQAGLQQFFAPVVMNAITDKGTEDTLEPREADVSVLFCDLRGFSRQSEKLQDRLLELLKRVSEALGVMTRHILDSGGVIGDFHGDAAMGFWGWPLNQTDSPAKACAAALAILKEFTLAARDGHHQLAGFRCGIGVATGRAVAGRIGSIDQVKVTAFGPVVNLASRLEGMTKQFSAEILVDETTADYIRSSVSSDTCRIRRLACIRPAGFEKPLVISQILPPEGPLCSLTDLHLSTYEAALDALMHSRWDDAFALLHEVPASDRAKDFMTVFIAQHGRIAPSNWDGVIDLPKH